MTRDFDIIVPTFNRYNELPHFFKKNAGIEYAPVTLWLIDDCSTQQNISALPNWKNLFFIQLKENRGQAYARNVGIQRSDSAFVISLDDDAWFEDVNYSVSELRRLFASYPKAGCIMFNVATPTSEYSDMVTGSKLPLHVTCGCAYRREVIKEIDGYSGFLHSQAEETDISLRIHRAGWDIIFSQEIKIFHNFSEKERPLSWYYYVRHNTTRNDLLIVVMYFPGILVLPFLIGKYISHLKFAVVNKVSILRTLAYTFKALLSFFRLLPLAIRNRRPLSLSQFRNWRVLFKST